MLVLVLALTAAGAAFADLAGEVTPVFNDFLGRLAAKHESLESLAMPGMEVLGEDGNQTAVFLRFENLLEQEAFAAALEAENIPYGSFGEAGDILLFSIDMMSFIMRDAMGL
jgi:hypothetical protein